MKTKMTVTGVVQMLKKDKQYKRLLNSFNTLSIYNIPKENLINELKEIHSLREVRRLSPKEDRFIDKLVVANSHDQSARSRCAEIMLTCKHVTTRLEKAVESIKQYYVIEYADHLRQFRTKEERSLVMNIALKKFIGYIDDVTAISEMSMIVISDIDKAAWSIRTSVEAVKIHSQREVQV